MNDNYKISFDWYNIQNFYKRYYDVKSDLIYESTQTKHKSFEVTIAIPTFRRKNLLSRAIDSAVNQENADDYEIIVVDNDEQGDILTDELMRSYCKKYDNIRYYRNKKNIGMTGNWNRCFELAQGNWVVLLHDDDVLEPFYLKNTMPWAIKSQCTMMGVFHTDLYDEEFDIKTNKKYGKNLKFRQNVLSYIRRKKPFIVKKTDIYTNIYPSPVCALFRKDKVIEFGGFDGKEGGAYDEKFFVTELYHGKVIILPQILAQRGVGVNESLNVNIQKGGIAGKYNFAMHILKKENLTFKSYKKFCADVSARYMIESIKGHFNENINALDLLEEMGVAKWVIYMPPRLVGFFKYLPLVLLIFRKKY